MFTTTVPVFPITPLSIWDVVRTSDDDLLRLARNRTPMDFDALVHAANRPARGIRLALARGYQRLPIAVVDILLIDPDPEVRAAARVRANAA